MPAEQVWAIFHADLCVLCEGGPQIETFYIVETSELNATSKCSRFGLFSCSCKARFIGFETFVGPFSSVRWPMGRLNGKCWLSRDFFAPQTENGLRHLSAHCLHRITEVYDCLPNNSRTFPSERSPNSGHSADGWWQKGSAPNQTGGCDGIFILALLEPFFTLPTRWGRRRHVLCGPSTACKKIHSNSHLFVSCIFFRQSLSPKRLLISREIEIKTL